MQTKDQENVELALGCAEYLPLRANSFDRVLIGGSINYFSSVSRTLREVARVAKPNAIIVIYEQMTPIDRLLGMDRRVLASIPFELEIVDFSIHL